MLTGVYRFPTIFYFKSISLSDYITMFDHAHIICRISPDLVENSKPKIFYFMDEI
jgi:hypothetical protein